MRELAFVLRVAVVVKKPTPMSLIIWIFPYEQLMVWNPDADEIIGGYRFFMVKCNYKTEWSTTNAMEHLFDFSSQFIEDYLPLYHGNGVCFCTTQISIVANGS